MPVRAFYRAILVRNAAVVAARLHPVMAAQRVLPSRQILARRCLQISERRRQAIAALFPRRPAPPPQPLLQTLRPRPIRSEERRVGQEVSRPLRNPGAPT